jgi:excisionase family DNA binding protein
MNALVSDSVVAQKLGVSRETIRRWRRSGRIPCHVLSERAIRFDLDAVLRSLDAKAGQSAGDFAREV